ncbi:NAD(+) diphosphatase [Blastococcus sp. Marseille-P5729]|uniref:NAD(+) diphosphatase n=1 Tax=Blastococcus sp. Marseille-P5729 TaxID=2086582 RepID=UPI000D0FEB89|nr:NAD(+) diphosphatase [Blastococcus sp. Marseille-P5729]
MPRVTPLFGEFEHDRDGEHRKDQAWLDDAFSRSKVLVLTDRFEAPIDESAGAPRIAWRDSSAVSADADRLYLGTLDGVPHFAVSARRDLKADQWVDLRTIGEALSVADRGLMVEAVALAQWHARHKMCPICGGPTSYREGGWSTFCEVDRSPHFPRTDPAVIMLVHDGADRCVLGRQAVWPEGRFSVLAGFVEPGETLEAAVVREVQEEVGVAVTDVEYAGSQPWPFPASVMLGFTARVEGPQELRLNDGEIAEADWFTREEVRNLYGWGDPAERTGGRSMPGAISIAHHLMKAWAYGELG